MRYYRLYSLSGRHVTGLIAEFTCEDDQAALEFVRRHDAGGPMELWELSRFVGRWNMSAEGRDIPAGCEEDSGSEP